MLTGSSPADAFAVLADAHNEFGGLVSVRDLLHAFGVVPIILVY